MAIAMRRSVTSAARPSDGRDRLGCGDAGRSFETPAVKWRKSLVALFVAGAAVGGMALTLAPGARAMPAPEVEYTFDVVVRKHYNFPNNDAIGYGYGICDKVSRGESYSQIMGDVKGEITPNDEFSANYLVSYAVNLLCPEQIWQLRNSAGGYRPPGGETGPTTYY
jgi:hypothetical protein